MFSFCPKCGAILKPNKKEDGTVVQACSCGYEKKAGSTASVKDEKKAKKEEAEVGVVDSEMETLPKTKEECPECGNNEAYYWLIQTRAGDESETKFLKCTKCKHTWRDYS